MFPTLRTGLASQEGYFIHCCHESASSAAILESVSLDRQDLLAQENTWVQIVYDLSNRAITVELNVQHHNLQSTLQLAITPSLNPNQNVFSKTNMTGLSGTKPTGQTLGQTLVLSPTQIRISQYYIVSLLTNSYFNEQLLFAIFVLFVTIWQWLCEDYNNYSNCLIIKEK